MKLRFFLLIVVFNQSHSMNFWGSQEKESPVDLKKSIDSLSDRISKLTKAIKNKPQPINIVNTSSSQNTSNQSSNIVNEVRNTNNIFISIVTGLQERAKAGYDSLKSIISNNRKKIFFGSVAFVYLLTNYKLFSLSRSLGNTSCWSFWRSDKSLEQLFEVSQKELAKDLVLDIQKRYTNPANPIDFVRPLVYFTQDLEKEKGRLTIYCEICKIVKKLYIEKIFCINTNLLNSCDDRLKKVAFLNGLFLSCAPDCKFEDSR